MCSCCSEEKSMHLALPSSFSVTSRRYYVITRFLISSAAASDRARKTQITVMSCHNREGEQDAGLPFSAAAKQLLSQLVWPPVYQVMKVAPSQADICIVTDPFVKLNMC
uniref:Uncharacterized protein n=1 Tax=Sphaerodactylus townsendi TaxID=933632 RepID=A0ACB8G9R5_9SAUR